MFLYTAIETIVGVVAGILITVILFFLFHGNLLRPLN